MYTEKLYDKDAYIKSFTASVLSCEKCEKRFKTVLDKTAFFPEGGGQGADTGYIGNARVIDVQEQNGIIFHFTDRECSGNAECKIDWEQRFSRMQNHSGEHLMSGLIHKYTSLDNISFSLTDEETSLAFNGELSDELIKKVETEANAAVFKNVKITARYPSQEELKTLSYRSKLELTENVRVVTIEGYDVCACCAPHCSATGEIGLIKVTEKEKYKGGTKLKIKCGFRALEDYGLKQAQTLQISHTLSVPVNKTAQAVEKEIKKLEQAQYNEVALKLKLIDLCAKNVDLTKKCVILKSDFVGDDLRLFAEKIKQNFKGVVLLLNGDDDSGYAYVLTSAAVDISGLVKPANLALSGKGGGRDNMARGRYGADFNTVKAYFESI